MSDQTRQLRGLLEDLDRKLLQSLSEATSWNEDLLRRVGLLENARAAVQRLLDEGPGPNARA